MSERTIPAPEPPLQDEAPARNASRAAVFSRPGGDDLGQFFDNLACGAAVLDQEFRALVVNPLWARIVGYEAEELEGRRLADFIVEEERDAHAARAERMRRAQGGIDAVQRRRIRHKSGRTVLVEGTVSPLVQSQGPPLFLATIFDVTAIIEAEEAQRASDERFRLAFENAPLGMGLFEPDGRVRLVNPNFAEMVGETPEGLVGRGLADLLPPEDVQMFSTRMASYEAGSGPLPQVRYRLRHRLGHLVPVEGGGAPLRDASGRITGYVVHTLDRTEQLRLEEQVRRAQRAETVGRIAGGVAHDFNNLLGIIRGAVGLLQAWPSDVALASELLGSIETAALRAADLTRQLTILGRRDFTTSGDSDPHEVLRDLRPVIAGALGEGIVLDIVVAPDVPAVHMTRPHLEQCLLNLALNARDALPDGGHFAIAVRAISLPPEDPRAGGMGGTWVEWRVSDDGVGMAPDVAAVAFEPFFTTKALGKGSGMGLAIVQGLVSQSGGHIVLDTRPGAGTVFTFTLMAAPPLSPSPAADPRPDASGRGETILLCEDEPLLLQVFTAALRGAGYAVHGTTDPAEALRIAAGLPHVDALVTDVVMPSMRGTVLAAELRRLHADSPVLFISGYSPERLGSAGDPAFGAFLAKPFRPAELVRAVRVLLG